MRIQGFRIPPGRGALLALALLSAFGAWAGTFRGEVVDAEFKKPLAGVTVTLRQAQLPQDVVVTTGADGTYRTPELPAGLYQVQFSREGFRAYTRGGISLRAVATLRLNAALLPNQFTEDLPELGAPPPAEAFLEPLPPALDYREAQSPVRNQAARGTCTAFGLMAALETLPGVPADLSEQWAYGQTKLQVFLKDKAGPYTQGTNLRNYLDTLTYKGVLPEEAMPYNPKAAIWTDAVPSRERFERDLAGARLFDLLSFAPAGWQVPTNGLVFFPGSQAKYIEWIQRQLHAGARGVAVGYSVVDPYWDQHRGTGLMKPEDCVIAVDGGRELTWAEVKASYRDQLWPRVRRGEIKLRTRDPHHMNGGHVVTIVGYDREGFLFKNSWGEKWGDRGYGRLSYDFHRIFADEACAIFDADFGARTATNSAAAFVPQAVRLKTIPTRTANGDPGVSLSLVWHGPGDPVVWRRVSYQLVATKSLKIWDAVVPASDAQAPGFRRGYPVEFPLGEANRDLDFLVLLKVKDAAGETVSLAFTQVRRQLAEYVSSTDRK